MIFQCRIEKKYWMFYGGYYSFFNCNVKIDTMSHNGKPITKIQMIKFCFYTILWTIWNISGIYIWNILISSDVETDGI
jgi:hypothetical protein